MSQPNDPYAVSGDGEPQGPQQPGQPPVPPPPAYPQSPPPYGQQPPAYGQQPPAYGQQPPAYGQQPGPYGQPPAAPPPQYGAPGGFYPKNNLGVWSLVLGLVGFFLCALLTSIPGVITGHLALKANKEGLANNHGIALAGTIISWIVTAIYVVFLGWLFLGGGLAWYLELIEEFSQIEG